MTTTSSDILLDADAVERTLHRIASEIVDASRGAANLSLIGIRRGGVPIAERLADAVGKLEKRTVDVGLVDIALYRDDAATQLPDPKIGPSNINFDVNGRDLVLVDDVLQTGRTIRAAIDCLLDFGRPRRIWLAVLVDRGGRELPIAPDFVGRTVDVKAGASVLVEWKDGHGRVSTW